MGTAAWRVYAMTLPLASMTRDIARITHAEWHGHATLLPLRLNSFVKEVKGSFWWELREIS